MERDMLSVIRVVGIVIFAVVLGLAADSLWHMQEDGTLFDKYNSERKSSITLLAVSVVALVSLGSFEMRDMGRNKGASRFGERRYTEDDTSEVNPMKTSSIYAAPLSIDEWKERKAPGYHSRRHRHKVAMDHPEDWLRLLQMICTALPAFYITIFSVMYAQGIGQSMGVWVFTSLCSCFLLLNICTAIGVFKTKAWGLSTGYLLAILNLVIFPVGTIIGLLLLISLVGASARFPQPARPPRGRMRSFG